MRYFLAIVFVGCAHLATGQHDVKFKRLMTPDGEPIIGRQFICQDREGYFWLAGRNMELMRLDGRDSRTFSSKELETEYFKDVTGSMVFEDSKKNLWAATNRGSLLRYNRSLDKFEIANDTTSSIRHPTYCQVEDTDGTFWLGTMGGGLVHFDPSSRKATYYQSKKDDPATLPDNYVVGVVLAAGKLWVATTGGLCSYDPSTDRFTRHALTNINPEDTYRYRVIRDVLPVDDRLILSTYGGLQIFDIRTLKSEHLIHNAKDTASLPHNSLFKAVKSSNSSLWIASYGGGLIHFDLATRKFMSWKNDPYDNESLSTNNLFSVYLDRQGIVWVAAADNTLCLFDTNAKKFHSVVHKPAQPNSISSGWIQSVLQQDDSIFWVGLNGNGLNKVNINTGVARKYVNDPTDKFSLGHNSVTSVYQDRKNRIWVGLQGGGLNVLDQKTGRFRRFEAGGKNSINNNAVSAAFADANDIVWVATFRGGLNIYDIQRNKFRTVNDDSLQKVNKVSLAFTERIFEWNGNIVFKTQQQIVLFDRVRGRFVKLAEGGEVVKAPDHSVIEVGPFTETELLLFTRSEIKTVKYIDPDHIEETVIMRRDPDDPSFRAFVVDQKNRVWAVTESHLVKLDLTTGERKIYSHSDGIVDRELVSIYLDRQGRIFITATTGLNWFYPDELRDDTVRREIRFTDFKLYNRSVGIGKPDSVTGFSLPGHISMLGEISLPHDQSFFSIEFSALEFFAPEKIQYAYKLDGFDKSWVQVGNRNFGAYTNLDPGRYTFHVKCANPDGFWSEPVSIGIVIMPPFWQTWWFMTLVIGLIAMVAYYVHNYRLSQSLKIERLRNKIASDLHDEVGSSLTRVSIYSELLRGEKDEAERGDYLRRISMLSREVVSTMSDIVWSIDSQSDTAGALLLRMKDFATELLQSKNIRVDFRIVGIPETTLLDPVVRQNIYLIFKEAINNVVKHANADHVIVEVQNDAKEFRLLISDNGHGFDTNRSGQGKGVRNMNRRGLAAGGSVVIQSERGRTSVTFTRKAV